MVKKCTHLEARHSVSLVPYVWLVHFFFQFNKLQKICSQPILLIFSFKSLLLRRNKKKRRHTYDEITRLQIYHSAKETKNKIQSTQTGQSLYMYFLSSIENTVLIRLKILVWFFSNRCHIQQEKLSASSWKIEIKKVVTKKTKHVITLGWGGKRQQQNKEKRCMYYLS